MIVEFLEERISGEKKKSHNSEISRKKKSCKKKKKSHNSKIYRKKNPVKMKFLYLAIFPLNATPPPPTGSQYIYSQPKVWTLCLSPPDQGEEGEGYCKN